MKTLLSCASCDRPVAKHAPACPHCGAAWPAGKPMGKGMGCLLLLAALIIVPFVLRLLGVLPTSTSTPRTAQQMAADSLTVLIRHVKFECQETTKSKLRSPTTATFSDVVASISTKDSGLIVVVGKVTAVNAFNAPITSDFGCAYKRATGEMAPILAP